MTDNEIVDAIFEKCERELHPAFAPKQMRIEIVRALIAARTPKEGHIIDDDGVMRRVDGRLPILADGVVAEYGNSYWYWDTINTIHQPTKYGWTERVLVSCDPFDAEYSWTTDPSLCYSTREAAEAAKGGF